MGSLIVTGNRDIDRALKRLPDAMQIKMVKPAIKKAGKEVTEPEIVKRIDQVPHDIGYFGAQLRMHPMKRSRTQFGVSFDFADNYLFILPRHGASGDRAYLPAIFEHGAQGKKKGYGTRSSSKGNRGRIRPFNFMREGLFDKSKELASSILRHLGEKVGTVATVVRAPKIKI